MTPVENLARYLVDERRRVDALISDNAHCEPYPLWESAAPEYRDAALVRAQAILDGLA